jgi:predicted Zn-dependent protease
MKLSYKPFAAMAALLVAHSAFACTNVAFHPRDLNAFAVTNSISALVANRTIVPNQDPLTLDELTKMVREMELHALKNDQYVYPVKVELLDDPEINAHATVEIDESNPKAKPQAVMAVYTGFVNHVKGDRRLIRAVIAHELSHLTHGHCTNPIFIARDLSQYMTRQQEREADMTGAALLIRAGHNPQDMIDLLMSLNDLPATWLPRVTSTHASPKQRASEIASNPEIWKGLVMFDVGLAQWDARNFARATETFDRVADSQPKLWEARANAAVTSLMYYYDMLPAAVQKRWYRPDFGPLLVPDPREKSRDPEIRAADKQRWDEAVRRIKTAIIMITDTPAVLKDTEALANVLNPNDDADLLKKGTDYFREQLKAAEKDQERAFQMSANLALGLQRQGKTSEATDVLNETIVQFGRVNFTMAESFGRDADVNAHKGLLPQVLGFWLKTATEDADWFTALKARYEQACKAANVTPEAISGRTRVFEPAESMTIDGQSVGFYDEESKLLQMGGKPDKAVYFDEKYKTMIEIVWKGGDLQAIVERGKLLRVTSRVPGSFIELRSKDRADNSRVKVEVGMSKADLDRAIPLVKPAERNLSNLGVPEKWLYYPNLFFCVQVKDDKVAAITVTAVDRRFKD